MITRIPPSRCGVAEYASMLITGLRECSDLEVVVLGDSESKDELPSAYLEPYSRVLVKKCFSTTNHAGLYQCIEGVKDVDLIHIQHEYGIFRDVGGFLRLLSKLRDRGFKVLITLHTVMHSLADAGLLNTQKRIVESVDKVIVHSVLQEHELIKQDIPMEKIHRIPHGTLLNPYVKESKDSLVRQLNLEPELVDRTVITTPGFIRAIDKDLSIVIKAVDLVVRRHELALLVTGSPQGEGADDVVNYMSSLSRRHVHFVGRFLSRDELLKILALSDVVVIPLVDKRKVIGVSGIFHLVIGSRKPVICTRTHKLAECNALAPELTLHTTSVEELAEKITLVIEGGIDVREAVARMWGYALETNWMKVAGLHCKLYKELAG